MTFKRFYHSLRLLTIRDEYKRADYLRIHNIFGGIGEDCQWGPWLLPLYPELIKLGNNVTVHKTAQIVVHDMINNFLQRCNPNVDYGSVEALGPVEINDNVYISMGVIILPNTKIGSNCIISAGSVVHDDIPDNSIVAGNPAKVIGRFDAFAALRKMNSRNNPVFKNQFISQDVSEKAWSLFYNKRSWKKEKDK